MRGSRSTVRGTARVRIGVAAVATALAALLVPGLTTGLVAADCAFVATVPDAMSGRDILFVGTVVNLENDNRWATVLVNERWQNADGLADTVEVRGGPAPGIVSSTERGYTQGRYLFDVTNLGPYLEDTSCSATTQWSEDLARYRPSNVAQTSSSSGSPLDALNSSDLILAAALVLALLVAVVTYILILRRRKRPPDWMR